MVSDHETVRAAWPLACAAARSAMVADHGPPRTRQLGCGEGRAPLFRPRGGQKNKLAVTLALFIDFFIRDDCGRVNV